jgi:AIPR protein/Abortive infection phage resistance protein N-terminal domain
VETELEVFYQEFFQEVHSTAEAGGQLSEDAFFDVFCRDLVESGEVDTADRTHFIGARGVRVDGYGGDPKEAGGTLTLIIADFNQAEEISTLTATEMNAIFKRLENFLKKSLDADFRNGLEETDPGFGLADLVNRRMGGISKIKLLLISNRALSSRVDGREAGEFEGIPVSYGVWDIGRLYKYDVAGHGREDLKIDLQDFGGPVLLLPAHLEGAGYEAYLAAIPGSQLASIYDKWGARLLEQNVRCFLQARSNVNKGIRNTILNDPEMFFAYNNGITATAESIETSEHDQGLFVTHLENFQIVNGGQTTASLHAASRNKDTDLSKVFVQMKLSIVNQEKSSEIVPKISEFANSQNRVNAADFFANHPFHVRMEDFSRRLLAPSPDGSFVQSKWFYERARGQYQDARAYLTQADRKRFDLEHPKRQVFSKTDLAKFLNVWNGHPQIVSQGAQKNFAHFAKSVGKEFDGAPDTFNEEYFKHSIAKAIIFRHVEKLVSGQDWYEGGYRANIVAYAISKLCLLLSTRGESLDFGKIWAKQGVSPSVTKALARVAKAVHDVIVNPPEGMRNISEWAKKDGCWEKVRALHVELPSGLEPDLLLREQEKDDRRAAVKDQKVLNEVEALMAVFDAGSEFWLEVSQWGQSRKLLSEREIGILASACSMPGKLPSEKQSLVILEVLHKLQVEGCPLRVEEN